MSHFMINVWYDFNRVRFSYLVYIFRFLFGYYIIEVSTKLVGFECIKIRICIG